MEYGNSNDPPTSVSVPRPESVRSQNSQCVRRTILLLVMWFLILSLVVYIAWQVKNPHLPDFRLNSLSVSNIRVSNQQFAASYDVEFTVNNMNKKVNVTIDDINISMLYGRAVVSERVLENTDCDVGEMSQEVLRAELAMDSVKSPKREVFKSMGDDWSKKKVNFNVQMSLRITYSFGIWPSKEKLARVSCKNLGVEFASTKGKGKLIGGGKFCLVLLPLLLFPSN